MNDLNFSMQSLREQLINLKNVNKQLQQEIYVNNLIKLCELGLISKEDYAIIAEEYYSSYGNIIKGTEFYEIFSDNIPDCCLVNVDEPGDDDKKEYCFHKILEETYDKLRRVLD